MEKFKEVDFYTYCPKCKHQGKAENEDPCWDCITEGVKEDGHRPVYFEEKETKR